MDDEISQVAPELARAVRGVLLAIARREEELAIREAAAVPYWTPCPASVHAHRAAAEALRSDADHFARAS